MSSAFCRRALAFLVVIFVAHVVSLADASAMDRTAAIWTAYLLGAIAAALVVLILFTEDAS